MNRLENSRHHRNRHPNFLESAKSWVLSQKLFLASLAFTLLFATLAIKFKDFSVRLFLKIIFKLYYLVVYRFNVYGKIQKYSLKWNLLQWNFLRWGQAKKLNMLVERNYHMLFTYEVIGSFGICVINPN